MFYRKENELNREYSEKMAEIKKKMADCEKEGMSEEKRNRYFAALLQESKCNEILQEYKRIHIQNIAISVVTIIVLLLIAAYVGRTM